MISTKDEKVFRVLDLVCEKETDGFEGLFTPVDIIAEEEIIGFWWEAAILEKSQKVIVLTVNVTYRGYRRYESRQDARHPMIEKTHHKS